MAFTGQLGTPNSRPGNIVPGLGATFSHTYFPTVSNTFVIKQKVNVIWFAKNKLTITQAVTVSAVRPIVSTLALTQVATVKKIATEIINQSLNFVQNVDRSSKFNLSASNVLVFQPTFYKPSGIPGLLIPVPNAVASKSIPSMMLSVPGHSIILPRPVFGDSETGTGKVDLKKAIDGTIYTYVKKQPRRILKYHFDRITRPKAWELRDFLKNNLAALMTLYNWKGQVWTGYIKTNPVELIPRIRGNGTCGELFEVEFEFEGVLIQG